MEYSQKSELTQNPLVKIEVTLSYHDGCQLAIAHPISNSFFQTKHLSGDSRHKLNICEKRVEFVVVVVVVVVIVDVVVIVVIVVVIVIVIVVVVVVVIAIVVAVVIIIILVVMVVVVVIVVVVAAIIEAVVISLEATKYS